jgi:hypothetical protein
MEDLYVELYEKIRVNLSFYYAEKRKKNEQISFLEDFDRD